MQPLVTDLAAMRRLAEAGNGGNLEFRNYLKFDLDWDGTRLDELVHRINAEVCAQIDCAECRNCCRTLTVGLSEADSARIALRLGLGVVEFLQRYTTEDDEGRTRLSEVPCVFLDGSRCTLGEAAPEQCRDYPHLHKPDFRSRGLSVLVNAEHCLIVFNVLERLKQELGFSL